MSRAPTELGPSNVLKAVELIGIRKQKCYAHGLDLVVEKAIFGSQATAFDVAILDSPGSREEDEAEVVEENTDNSNEADADDGEEEDASHFEHDDQSEDVTTQTLENTRLRKDARDFRKKPIWMDEIRRVTAKDEFNKKSLCVKLDCKTRWYSTLVMIERALGILPALNNVLSRYDTSLSTVEAMTLEKITSVLAPFKRAMLILCKNETTPGHADKVFAVLLKDLLEIDTKLSWTLRQGLEEAIFKRCFERTGNFGEPEL